MRVVQVQETAGAAGCARPADPAQGRVLCNTARVRPGSRCLLDCRPGWVPAGPDLTECGLAGDWSVPAASLQCVRPLAMLIGKHKLFLPGGCVANIEYCSTMQAATTLLAGCCPAWSCSPPAATAPTSPWRRSPPRVAAWWQPGPGAPS